MLRIVHVAACGAAAAGLMLAGVVKGSAAGAIAIGACAAYGYAYDYADVTQASTAALGKCAGRACRVVATMRRNCAAFAIDGRNVCGPHGFAVASRLGRAQNVALRQCYKYGGRDCVIRAWACDAKD